MKKHSQFARFQFALAGLKAAWKRESSFRTEIVIAVATVIWMVWIGFPLKAWLGAGLIMVIVFVAELVNSAIEALCDAVHPDQHPLIKVAKDCASAAVLVSVSAAAFIFAGLVYWKWH